MARIDDVIVKFELAMGMLDTANTHVAGVIDKEAESDARYRRVGEDFRAGWAATYAAFRDAVEIVRSMPRSESSSRDYLVAMSQYDGLATRLLTAAERIGRAAVEANAYGAERLSMSIDVGVESVRDFAEAMSSNVTTLAGELAVMRRQAEQGED